MRYSSFVLKFTVHPRAAALPSGTLQVSLHQNGAKHGLLMGEGEREGVHGAIKGAGSELEESARVGCAQGSRVECG